jgi:ABC-type glutathione transport system ATPase component
MSPLLSIRDLRVEARGVALVAGASFDVAKGESVAIVGASGSGKSTLCRALLGISDDDVAVTHGPCSFDGEPLFASDGRVRDGALGRKIGAVFQNPSASLTPHMTVEGHFRDMAAATGGASRSEVRSRARELLTELRVDDPDTKLAAYPHRLSGGLAQRVALALALFRRPDLLVADEPTTALDATSSCALLRLLLDAASTRGAAMLIVTHDLSVVAGVADRAIVLDRGRIAEDRPVADVLSRPRSDAARVLVEAARRGAEGAASGDPR